MVVLLQSEIPSGKCAKLHTVAASNNIEITFHDHSIVACSCQKYMGVILLPHPVRGEPRIQRNASQEVATVSYQCRLHPNNAEISTFLRVQA